MSNERKKEFMPFSNDWGLQYVNSHEKRRDKAVSKVRVGSIVGNQKRENDKKCFEHIIYEYTGLASQPTLNLW